MNIIKHLLSGSAREDNKAYLERRRQEWMALDGDPNYYSFGRYTKTIEFYLNEPVQKEYVTKELIHLFVTSLREQGYIPNFGGGWRGTFGEEYIRMKSGRTPSVAMDKDPIIFYRKSKAAHHMAVILNELFERGFTDKLLGEVLESIDKEWVE